MKKNEQRIVVSPRSYVNLRDVAKQIRKMARKADYINDMCLDVVGFYGYLAGEIPDSFRFHVAEASELPDSSHEGLTKPNGEILIREDVFDGACDGNGRDRFTMVHELEHWFMHRKSFGFARSSQTVPSYKCPEWQANTAASFTLMPTGAVRRSNANPIALAELCEVSPRAAEVRCDIYRKRSI